MKNLFLSLLVAVGLVGRASASPPTNAPSTLKPQWTCFLTNPITFQDGTTSSWGVMNGQFLADSSGDLAILIGEPHSAYSDILWISSKGNIIATIKINSNTAPSILSVSSSTLYTKDVENDVDPNGNPYQFIKYTINGGKVIRTPFCIGEDVGGYQDNGTAPFSYSGIPVISATDGSGNPTALSFYKF
jgi:hypothetical protein